MTAEGKKVEQQDIASLMDRIGRSARASAAVLARTESATKDAALGRAAELLESRCAEILKANGRDMEAARARGLSASMLDRLRLDEARVRAMAAGIRDIVALPDPVGQVMAEWDRPNGLVIQRVRVPLGVIGIVYESRPNVTADAGALCLKSGNAAILRGGSESFYSSHAIHACLETALEESGLPGKAIQMIPTTDREAVGYLLGSMAPFVDVVVPRGGKNLIARVQRDARVPVIGHLEGLCHVYVDGAADLSMAIDVVLNSKMRRTGICGAAETLLVDRACATSHLRPLVRALLEAGCEVRGDTEAQRADPRVVPASPEDWDTEYLDAIIAVRTVDALDGAIRHIADHGSGHTDSIITDNAETAERFLSEVDSAIVLHNASTQFADGGEFGMGAEIGISTGRVHARGPVGAEQLTSFNYRVRGRGQTRPA
ncbi:MAG: glutamate-5-semialdehyde dehydrogenase [Gammaproteobacteria bacterium]|jgi:glutamate-5-semialdehyde dehydrogenase